MYIGELIKNYRINHNLSQRAFASKTSLSASYINTLEKIYNPKTGKPYSVTTDVALDLANAMNISIEELLDKLNDNQEFVINNEEKNQTKNSLTNVPIVGKIAAGQPILATENIEGYLPVDPAIYGLKTTNDLFFLRVSGESMNLKVKNGDYALIHKQDYANDGDIIVAIVNGNDEATLKKYKKLNNQFIVLEPMSSDTSIQSIVVNLKNTNLKILGKAIGQFGKF